MRLTNRIALTALAVASLALAQTDLAQADQSDPPGRVGRLNYVNGTVSFQPAGVEEWAEATLNRPLTAGDRLWIDQRSRAEVHIGSAAVRIGSATEFEFLNLTDSAAQIRLSQGTLTVTLRHLDDNEAFEVDTPNLAFSLLREGEYRIDANPDTQMTTITVRAGEGEATGSGQAFTVHPRQQAQVTGADTISYDLRDAPSPDDWDNWCADRDRREERSVSAQYVSRDMVGYEDLDSSGDWRSVPEYGTVWTPRGVAADWAPYRYGHWAWIDPWGWTWVDDAPWGFAPFHYGRWAYYGGGWIWVPGPVRVRPAYAPALVAWVGGPRFGAGVSFGGPGIGWFPLGPREAYVPVYRSSPRYLARVNTTTVINNVNVTNIRYVNQTVPGAVTAMPQNAMASGRRASELGVRIRAQELQSAQVLNGAPVVPQRESLFGRPGNAGAPRPPASALTRTVVVRSAPPPPPVSFTQRQQVLSGNPGRPIDPAEMDRLRARDPGAQRYYVRQAGPARPVLGPHTNSPITGGPAVQNTPRPGPAPNTPRDSGWQRRTDTPRNSDAPRFGDTPRNTNTPRTDVPRNDAPRITNTPRNDAPRNNEAPHIQNTPPPRVIESPRVVNTPHPDTPRMTNTPRNSDSPRAIERTPPAHREPERREEKKQEDKKHDDKKRDDRR